MHGRKIVQADCYEHILWFLISIAVHEINLTAHSTKQYHACTLNAIDNRCCGHC